MVTNRQSAVRGSQFAVRSSQFAVRSSRFEVLLAMIILLCASCDPPAPANTNTTPKTDSRTAIGVTGYTIDLLPGYLIEPDTIFKAYYFKPSQSNPNESEAGMYIGPKPDTASPMIEFVKRQYRDVFMGDSVTWTEYATAKYIQREAFVEKTPMEKIHVWCYSRDGSDLARLYDMVKTIR